MGQKQRRGNHGLWLRYFGTGKKEQKALSISGEMKRTLFSRLSSSVLSTGPCLSQAAEYGCRTEVGML